jgi:hypothetical protein
MTGELRRLKRRLDWLETFVTVLDTRTRTLGLRVDLHVEECEPSALGDRETAIRDAMGREDAKLFLITEMLHAIAARQDAQAAELSNLTRLLGNATERLTEGNPT